MTDLVYFPFIIGKETFIEKIGIFEKRIGKGTSGNVYSTDKGYAVKKILTSGESFDEDDYQRLTREISILRYLNHPNIINIFNVQLKPPKLALSFAKYGTLDKISLDNIMCRKWIFYQLFRGLAYCHSKNIWHRDIKPKNILIFNNPKSSSDFDKYIVKIADFNISFPKARQGNNWTNVVSLYWKAPELLLEDGNYSESIDVWSLGVILLNAILKEKVLSSDFSDSQLEEIVDLIGIPKEEDYPEIKTLMVKRGLENLYKSYEGKENRLSTSFSFDLKELEILSNTITWEKYRLSALDIINLEYFDEIRKKLDTLIPAKHIDVQNYKKIILEDQETPKNSYSSYNYRNRNILFSWIKEILGYKYFDLSKRTLFYTFLLIDIYAGKVFLTAKEILLYGCAAITIASEQYEMVTINKQELVNIGRNSYGFTKKELSKAIRNILIVQDFNIIIPSCEDFIYEYLKNEKCDIHDYNRVLYYAFVLILNYDYVLKYTQEQIARASIEAVCLEPKCLENHSLIYNREIHNYLKEFIPPKSLEEEHEKYFYPFIKYQIFL